MSGIKCTIFLNSEFSRFEFRPHPHESGYSWNHTKLPNFVHTKTVNPLNETTSFENAVQSTGSRGDVFVVRTSNPVENLRKNGFFWSRNSFVTHSIDCKPRDWGLARSAYSIKYSALRASVALRATCLACEQAFVERFFPRQRACSQATTCRAQARIWLAVIDFQKSIIVYSRFIKMALG